MSKRVRPDGHEEVSHGVSEGLGVGGEELPCWRVPGVHGKTLGRSQKTAGRLYHIVSSL